MPLTSFPNGISSFGVPVLGGGGQLPATTGSYFFVDSAQGNNGNDGTAPDRAKANLDNAINLTTANQGDVIVLMPNHAETISGAATIVPDVAGITIIGLGFGANRPTIDFDNTASQIILSAADITVSNVVFECSVDSLVAAISVTAAGASLVNCEFAAPTTAENPLIWVLTDANADSISVLGCRTSGLGNFEAGPAAVLRLIGTDDAIIKNNFFMSESSVGIIDNPTTACLRIEIGNNILLQINTTVDLAIDLFATTTGHVYENSGRCGDGAPLSAAIDAGNTTLAQNFFANLDAETGALAGAVST